MGAGDEEQLLTSAEVAKRLRVTPRTIARWVKEGRITAAYVTPGGLYRFRWDDFAKSLGFASPAISELTPQGRMARCSRPLLPVLPSHVIKAGGVVRRVAGASVPFA